MPEPRACFVASWKPIACGARAGVTACFAAERRPVVELSIAQPRAALDRGRSRTGPEPGQPLFGAAVGFKLYERVIEGA